MPQMPTEERESLLKELHVAILAVARAEGPPLSVPIWYEYRDGLYYMDTDTETLHAKLMAARGEATLTIQDESAPYRYISVEGSVEFLGDRPADTRSLVGRYLGAEAVDGFIENVRSVYQPNAETVVLTPTRTWSAWFPE